MLISFREAIKLKTKKMIYDEGCNARDSATQELLKELSTKRRAIEESINGRSHASQEPCDQDMRRLEQYLPPLAYLVAHAESLPKDSNIHTWVSGLKIQWSSAMASSCYLKIGGPRFYRIDSLRFEMGMSLFLYGAVMRERAFVSTDLVESATLFRRAAGVYSHLAEKVLPPLKQSSPRESPVEAASSMSSVMSFICLADAQAVAIKRGEERGSCPMVLSKLHYGITQILDEATSILTAKPGELNGLSAMVKEVISACKVLHELRSQRYMAEELRGKEQIGIGIAVLQQAMATARKAQKPKNAPYASVFLKEIEDAAKMLKKFEHENDFVWHEKIPSVNMAPSLQGTRIVSAVPYEHRTWEGEPLSLLM